MYEYLVHMVMNCIAWHLLLDSNYTCNRQLNEFRDGWKESYSERYQHESVVINYIRFSFIQHQNRIPIGWLSILAAATATPITTHNIRFTICVCAWKSLPVNTSHSAISIGFFVHRKVHNGLKNHNFVVHSKHSEIHCFPIWPFPLFPDCINVSHNTKLLLLHFARMRNVGILGFPLSFGSILSMYELFLWMALCCMSQRERCSSGECFILICLIHNGGKNKTF